MDGTKVNSKQRSISAVLHRSLHEQPLKVVSAEGIYLHLENGQKVVDATGGAAVACLGHGHPVVRQAVVDQIDKLSYCHSLFYSTDAAEGLCSLLVEGTQGKMSRAFIVSSGSEAAEAAMKMARQYFIELEGKATRRKNFIARGQSYHGTTLGALGLGGHVARREIYEPLLSTHVTHVSPCYPYRGLQEGETDGPYIDRLAGELDDEFKRLGPDTVCAFVAEPMVGAALGCVPAIPGYFAAMKRVCEKYGALLIMDEIMCGMGRSGYLHMWQSPIVDTVPDLQLIGKGLGGGYQPVAGLLVGPQVVSVLEKGTGAFSHGQTYQGHPVACAAAAAVQKIVMQPDLLENVRAMGQILEAGLRAELEDRWYVGNIRGTGLFLGVEFVRDKHTKEPFEVSLQVALGIHNLGLQEPYSISLYPGSGTADGWRGDHILLAPPYNCNKDQIEMIVKRTVAVITHYFETKYDKSHGNGRVQNEQKRLAQVLHDPQQGSLLPTG